MKYEDLTAAERQFLQQVHDPDAKPDLLARLERLGLLAAFLQAEAQPSKGVQA